MWVATVIKARSSGSTRSGRFLDERPNQTAKPPTSAENTAVRSA